MQYEIEIIHIYSVDSCSDLNKLNKKNIQITQNIVRYKVNGFC